MTRQARKALTESIAHWERMRDDYRIPEEPGPDECPLCQEFLHGPAWCKGCPVAAATGRRKCRRTPYVRARDCWLFLKVAYSVANVAAWKKAAQAEIDFLKSIPDRLKAKHA